MALAGKSIVPMATPSVDVTTRLAGAIGSSIVCAGALVKSLMVVVTTPRLLLAVVSVFVTPRNAEAADGVTVSVIRSSSSVTVKLNNPLSSVVATVPPRNDTVTLAIGSDVLSLLTTVPLT